MRVVLCINVGVNVIESPVLLFYVLVWVSTFYLVTVNSYAAYVLWYS